ncbi:MAG: metal-dependent hydrolase [Chitinophagia bacterium]|nr:metal-dependent hydrolase [Chitinophagia bacterium]
MRLSCHGHSCFSVEISGRHLLFDPFITPNPHASGVDADTVQADVIFVTHGHDDHMHDCEAIARRTSAPVVCNFELSNWLRSRGLENLRAINTGGCLELGFCTVKAVVAHHSSSLPDGSYGGSPLGFAVRSKEGCFYYSGDTSLTMDMQLVPSFCPPDFVMLPIGDVFTMGIEDAARAARLLNCRRVVGLHYDTFPAIRIDREAAITHFKKNGLELTLPEPGSTIEI